MVSDAELFPSPQGDLFGAAPVTSDAYVVPYHIAVNTLSKTWQRLSVAETWPWDPDMKAARMDRSVPKLLAVLPPEEAEAWRARLDVEAARLDAVSPA